LRQEDDQHQVATEKRLLESELQANESEERRQTREEKVERDERIRDEVSEIVSIFRCDVCNKQYATDDQYQEHLNVSDILRKCKYTRTCKRGTEGRCHPVERHAHTLYCLNAPLPLTF
jgi:hypothetical protein